MSSKILINAVDAEELTELATLENISLSDINAMEDENFQFA